MFQNVQILVNIHMYSNRKKQQYLNIDKPYKNVMLEKPKIILFKNIRIKAGAYEGFIMITLL